MAEYVVKECWIDGKLAAAQQDIDQAFPNVVSEADVRGGYGNVITFKSWGRLNKEEYIK